MISIKHLAFCQSPQVATIPPAEILDFSSKYFPVPNQKLEYPISLKISGYTVQCSSNTMAISQGPGSISLFGNPQKSLPCILPNESGPLMCQSSLLRWLVYTNTCTL